MSSFFSFIPIGDMNAYQLAEYAIDALVKLGWQIKPNDEDADAPVAERTHNGIPLKAEFWWTDNPNSATRTSVQDATDMVVCVQSIGYQRARRETIDELRSQLADAIESRKKNG